MCILYIDFGVGMWYNIITVKKGDIIMYKLVILTTGDEWEFRHFGELVLSTLDCYNIDEDNNLICEILTNLVKLEKGEIKEFTIENGKGIWVGVGD